MSRLWPLLFVLCGASAQALAPALMSYAEAIPLTTEPGKPVQQLEDRKSVV